MSKSFRILAASLITVLAGAASAQTASLSKPDYYAGAGLGVYNKYSLRCTAGAACDRTADLGGKIYGGADFGSFGVEALAFGLKSAQGSLKNGSGLTVPGSVSMSGVGVVGVMPYALGDFTLKGRLGLGYVRGKASIGSGVQDDSSVRPLVGLGASYALNKQVSLNADFDRFDAKYSNKGKVHANMLSVGVSYKF